MNNSTCWLYGAHYWKLDAKSYGKCKCGAEQDFAEKEKHKTYVFVRKIKFESEFYK